MSSSTGCVYHIFILGHCLEVNVLDCNSASLIGALLFSNVSLNDDLSLSLSLNQRFLQQ